MTREEQRIVVILADHREWVATFRPGSMFDRQFSAGMRVEDVARYARLHRRAARRALTRLIDAGRVTCTETFGGERYRLAVREAGTVVIGTTEKGQPPA